MSLLHGKLPDRNQTKTIWYARMLCCECPPIIFPLRKSLHNDCKFIPAGNEQECLTRFSPGPGRQTGF